MHTKRTLINLAMVWLGQEGVSEADLAADPPSSKVEKALANYEQAADTAQASAPWLCCLEWRTLDPDATVPAEPDTVSAYLLPDRALHVWSVDLPEGTIWRQAVAIGAGDSVRKVVRADWAQPLTLAYTRRTPVAGWDPLLADAFGLELAARLAGPINGDSGLGQQLRNRTREAYAKAAGADMGRSQGHGLHGPGGMAQARAQAH